MIQGLKHTTKSSKCLFNILIILFTVLLSGCFNNESNSQQKVGAFRIIKPPSKYYTDFNNIECLQQIDSAKRDMANGKLVYVNTTGWEVVRYDDQIPIVLNEYAIDYQFGGVNCTMEQECYGYYMDSIISAKYGKNFIQKVEAKSDSLFLSKWRTKTYRSWDIDKSPFFIQDAESYIKKNIEFPKGWDKTPLENQRQYLVVDVTISSEGRLVDWKIDELFNLKKTNFKFRNYLNEEINRILQQMESWEAGELEGKKVNSIVWLDIDLDTP